MLTQQHTLRISKRGQITLPRDIRRLLGSGCIRLILMDGYIRIESVASVAGSLREYAKPGMGMAKETETAWNVRSMKATETISPEAWEHFGERWTDPWPNLTVEVLLDEWRGPVEIPPNP